MVKNVKGGSGHKSQARKFSTSTTTLKQSSKLRVVQENGEVYAQIAKMYGNGMCDALCIDNVNRLCIIRGKFRGRGKRDNTLRVGSWVLVGKREWESTKAEEKQKCDLLEVYSDLDVERLKKNVNENWKLFVNLDNVTKITENEDFEFSNTDNEEYKRIMQTLEETSSNKLTLDVVNEDEEEIDIWDI